MAEQGGGSQPADVADQQLRPGLGALFLMAGLFDLVGAASYMIEDGVRWGSALFALAGLMLLVSGTARLALSLRATPQGRHLYRLLGRDAWAAYKSASRVDQRG